MKYALIAYIVALALYDDWGLGTVVSNIIYYTITYGFAMSVALIEMIREKERLDKIAYIAIAMVFAVLILVTELPYLFATETDYAQRWNDSPVFLFTAFIIIVFITYETYTRWKKR